MIIIIFIIIIIIIVFSSLFYPEENGMSLLNRVSLPFEAEPSSLNELLDVVSV